MLNWLRRIFQRGPLSTQAGKPDKNRPVTASNPRSGAGSASGGAGPHSLRSLRSQEQAGLHLERLHAKINALAERFASGNINRAQFQELYDHYQDEIQTIEAVLREDPTSEEWKNAITEGQSMLIRRRNMAVALGFSIYENVSGMPLKSLGEFGVDPALFVPMLSAYRSAAEEIFGAGLRSTQIEGGKWLSFVPGKLTTTLALFSTEPSAKQMKTLEEVHRLFEKANARQLGRQPMNVDGLVCPHEFFINHTLL